MQKDTGNPEPAETMSWFVLPVRKTLIAIASAPFLLLIAWRILHVGGAPIGVLAFLAAVFSVPVIHFATRGGIILRAEDRHLVRWWGIFFPFTSRETPLMRFIASFSRRTNAPGT